MALVQYIQACGATPLDSLRLFKELNDKLADPECMRRLQCQMGELAGGQEQGRRLDTMEQLQFVCHCGVVKAAGAAREQAANALSASQLLDVMLAAAEQLQQLEPTNPKSYPLADLSGSSGPQRTKLQEWRVQVARLGRQQHSDYWSLFAACLGMVYAFQYPAEAEQEDVSACLEYFEHSGEAALRRCKRLLPDRWVLPLGLMVKGAGSLLAGTREQLQRASDSSSAAGLAAIARLGIVKGATAEDAVERRAAEDLFACDGCGKRAVGMRRCARCQRAQYCRCVSSPLANSALAAVGLPACLPALACSA